MHRLGRLRVSIKVHSIIRPAAIRHFGMRSETFRPLGLPLAWSLGFLSPWSRPVPVPSTPTTRKQKTPGAARH